MSVQNDSKRLAAVAAGAFLAAGMSLGSVAPALAVEAPTQSAAASVTSAEAAALKQQKLKIIEFHRLVNQFRQSNGVAPMTFNVGAAADAYDWSRTQAQDGQLKHQQPHQRYQPLEGLWGAWGENVAYSSSQSTAEMFTQWKNSPGHRANMLSERFDTYGVAFFTDSHGRMYGTTVFYGTGSGLTHLPYTYASPTAYFNGQAALPTDGSTPQPAGPFSDVSANHTFLTPITWMKEEGVTTGYADGSFRPGQAITRGEAASFLYRISGDQASNNGGRQFTDVDPTTSHYQAIRWMAKNHYSLGYGDQTFRPNQQVTRAELASFVFRASEENHTATETSPFGDVSESSSHYLAISWLRAQGGTSGYADGTFRPGRDVTRGETAKMLYVLK
ncbi:CAP and S-layer homology domain-containing protein [Citricoccus zhacaiensis]